MDKRFAVFDMDGTLVDSMAFWQQLGREYLVNKGVTENLESVLERIKPMTISQSAELFVREFGLVGTSESMAEEMNHMMEWHYRGDIPLKAGVKAYLEQLHRSGVRLCVASATAWDLMEACLSRLGVAGYFEFLLSCEEIGKGKDKPDVYLEAAKRLGAAPQEIAVYEDALYAANTAKKAGFYTVAVWDDSGKHYWEELSLLADEVVRHWSETEDAGEGSEL